MAHFEGCLEAIDQNSSNAKVFVLIHKMDLVPEDKRHRVILLSFFARSFSAFLTCLSVRSGVGTEERNDICSDRFPAHRLFWNLNLG